jgi:hypothetical protein
MAYCSNCGTELNNGAKFCPNCGTSIKPVGNPKKGHGKTIIWPAASFVVLVALAVGCCFLWNKKDYSLEGLAKVVINYDYIENFHDGLAMVTKGDKIGFIDKMGNEVIPCVYDPLEMDVNLNFSNGLALVYKDDKLFYINKKGEKAFPFNYAWTSGFSEGYAIVEKDGKYGFIDTTGKEIVPCIYDYVNDFSDGMAAVIKGNKYGYIDTKGNVIIPITLDVLNEINNAYAFHEGLVQIAKNGKIGFIDKSGNEVIPCQFDNAFDFSEGLAIICMGEKYGYIDTKGNVVIPCEYEYAYDFAEGLAPVKKDGKNVIINKSGEVVFTIVNDIFPRFCDGLARISKNDGSNILSGFINTKGNEVIPCVYSCWNDFSEGLVAVSKDGINGYVDKNGNSTFDVQDEEVKKLVQAKIEERKEEERKEEERRAEEERKRIEEGRKGVEKVVTLSFTRPERAWDRDLSCTGNYGAIITAQPNQYAVTEYIPIPSGKIWVYESYRRIEGDPDLISLWYYSRESGALRNRLGSYDSEYLLKKGGIPILRPGDGFRISFVPFSNEGTKSIEVYFREKDEEFAY